MDLKEKIAEVETIANENSSKIKQIEDAIAAKETWLSRIMTLEVNQDRCLKDLSEVEEKIEVLDRAYQKIEIIGKVCETSATPTMMRLLIAIAIFLLFPKAEPLVKEIIQEIEPSPTPKEQALL
jgi:hypothetical protein